MSKYAPEALKSMALFVAEDDAEGGEDSLRLYVAIALKTDMRIDDVRAAILEHAECAFT